MRVLLIEIADVGPTFLAEPEPGPKQGAASHAGLWAWVARRRAAVVDDLDRGRGWIGRGLGGIWHRLQRLVAHDEHLLRSLRRANRVDLDHPANLPRDVVDRAWREYLSRRAHEHRVWLIVDAVLSPFSLILVPLPGPNVVGFWLVYRFVVHLFAMNGASRCRRGRVETSFRPRDDLDGRISLGDHERIDRLAESLLFPDLFAALARVDTRDAASST